MDYQLQLNSFIIFLLDGIIIGLIFDFFRILRRSIKTPDLITYLEDIILSLIIGIILILSIVIFNNGELRLYIFLGLIVGLLLYLVTVSKYIIRLNTSILSIFITLIKKVFKILSFPFILIIKMINIIINKIKCICKKYIKKAKIVKK